MSVRHIRTVLVGVGNVGRAFLELLLRKRPILRAQYGIDLTIVAAVDSSGAALRTEGLDLRQVLQLKDSGQGVAEYPQGGEAGTRAVEMLGREHADLLVELSPANLKDGQPGLGCITQALRNRMHVVTANKSPLVLAYQELMDLAKQRHVTLSFSATVGGALPSVGVGQRELVGCDILRLEGVLNLTTNYILTQMTELGKPFGVCLAEAQQHGVAEADARLDTGGWDSASKLTILANSVLGHAAHLADIRVEGMEGISLDDLAAAKAQGKVIKLVATAEKVPDGYRLAVQPVSLALNHVLAHLGAMQMGIAYHTDTMGTIAVIIEVQDTVATAAALLRDIINIYGAHVSTAAQDN